MVREELIQEKEHCITILMLRQGLTLYLLEFIMIKVYKKILMLILLFMLNIHAKLILLLPNKQMYLQVEMLIGILNKIIQVEIGIN